MSAAKVLPLAWADWCAEARLSACAVLGLAAVLAPLLVLFGLKYGLVATLTERLLADPRTRELLPVGSHVYDLFANYKRYDTTPGTTTWGDYHVRNVISGMMVVHPAVTQDPPRREDD